MQVSARSLPMVMDTRTVKRLAWLVSIACTIIGMKAGQRLSVLIDIPQIAGFHCILPIIHMNSSYYKPNITPIQLIGLVEVRNIQTITHMTSKSQRVNIG